MKILVANRPNKISLKLIKDAINFYSSQLIKPRLDKNITLKINFNPNLYKNQSYRAQLGPENCVEQRPRCFEMDVDSIQSVQMILKSFAHEMVHLKQFAIGELKDYAKDEKTRWMNQVFISSNDNEDTTYWFQPWEIEAYGKEIGLYHLFKKHRRKKQGTIIK